MPLCIHEPGLEVDGVDAGEGERGEELDREEVVDEVARLFQVGGGFLFSVLLFRIDPGSDEDSYRISFIDYLDYILLKNNKKRKENK